MSQKTLRQDEKFSLSLQLSFPSGKAAEIAGKAVLPELNAGHARRSSTVLNIKKRTISINIKAGDKVALRAALNSCLNSIILAKRVMEV